MQRQQPHGWCKLVLARAQASEAAVVGGIGRNYCSNPTAQSYDQRSLTHRLHAHELTTQVEQVLSLGSQAVASRLRGSRWPGHSGGPVGGLTLGNTEYSPAHLLRVPLQHSSSVGCKGGFFQAKIGPVDRQSLSGLSCRIQAEPFEILHFPFCLIHIHTV